MKIMPARKGSSIRRLLGTALLVLPAAGAAAADLVVQVSGLQAPVGPVGCTLFSGERGFPTDASTAVQSQWVTATGSTATCRFPGVPAGRHAVSVAHDANGNRKVDTNLVGIPKEQWGVSNNIRPTMRAPRFAEAAFDVAEGAGERVIEVRVSR
jgi:uncharacterized protein (DUF2141 family)